MTQKTATRDLDDLVEHGVWNGSEKNGEPTTFFGQSEIGAFNTGCKVMGHLWDIWDTGLPANLQNFFPLSCYYETFMGRIGHLTWEIFNHRCK